MEITLEGILAIVIILITLNLLFVGVYIVKVLKEALRTIRMAQVVIDDVDESIKDGVEKMKSMEKPLQAMAMTTEAVTGVFKGAGALTKKLVGNSNLSSTTSIKDASTDTKDKKKKKRVAKPKFFKKKS